jgi:hypothetical protein
MSILRQDEKSDSHRRGVQHVYSLSQLRDAWCFPQSVAFDRDPLDISYGKAAEFYLTDMHVRARCPPR